AAGRLRARRGSRAPDRPLRRHAGGARGARARAAPALPAAPDSVRVEPALPRAGAGRGARGSGRDRRLGRAHPLRRARLPEAGALDGGAARGAWLRDGRRRRRLRLPRRREAAGARVDAGRRPRVAVPARRRAAPALAPLPGRQLALPLALPRAREPRLMAFRARVLVTGAGGFIGHHLVRSLVERGYWVRGVDLVPPRF